MKLKHVLCLVPIALALQTISLSAQTGSTGLVAHEWGTFTSFQGGDGALIPWKPLRTSRLPNFVHNWSKPGLNIASTNMMLRFGKGQMTSLQRLETPVIYFY